MKKRIKFLATLTMVIVMMASTMAGCGKENAPTNAISTSTTEPTFEPEPTTEPAIDNSEDGVVDSGVLGSIPTSESNEDGDASLGKVSNAATRYDYTEQWKTNGNNAEGWNDAYSYMDGSNRVYNVTHFVTGTGGNEMSFSWIAPVSGIGTYVALSSSEIVFNMNDAEFPTYIFAAWNYGPLSTEDELMKNYDANIIMEAGIGTPIEDSFTIEDNDEYYRVIFKETYDAYGKSYISYNCYFDFYDIMECWQFGFYVEEFVFDENEALAVINSITRIDLEEYESTLTINE